MSRNKFVSYQGSQVIGTTAAYAESMKARRENNRLENAISNRRKRWRLSPAENMTLMLRRDAGAFPAGLVVSVSHEIGRMLLHRRLASILERELVTVDAVIEGELEEAVEALDLVKTNGYW